MRCVGFATAALCFIVASSAAFSATVQPGQGSVSVNKGTGFRKISSTTQLKPGDQVMVSPGGAAQVLYNGCAVTVQAGAVYIVQPDSVCGLALNVDAATPYVVGAGVIGGGIAAGVLLSQKSGPTSP